MLGWVVIHCLNWLSCIKLFILCLYSRVSITSVFPLSAYVELSLFIAILFFKFFITYHSSLFLLFYILFFRMMCLMVFFFLQLVAYSTYVRVYRCYLLRSSFKG
jgi:hypothetical protein